MQAARKQAKEEFEGRLTPNVFAKVREDLANRTTRPFYAHDPMMDKLLVKARIRNDKRKMIELEEKTLAKTNPVGSLLTPLALTKIYECDYAPMVLDDFVQNLPRTTKGERSKIKVVKPLPGRTAYAELKLTRFTLTIGTLLEDSREGYNRKSLTGG